MKGKSMAERHIYGSDHKYKGSMDDDGRIYDAHHRFIGRVKNGTIYDDCNIPRGHINSDGRVTDMCNIPTGREFGANFEGWGGHGGYSRNDARGSPEDGSPHLFYTSLMVRQGPRHQRIHVPAQISAT